MSTRYTKGMLTSVTARPRRLIRGEARPFKLTTRDSLIIALVSRFRFMTSAQIVRFLQIHEPETSAQNILRRLALLFAHRYLDRPEHQHFHLTMLSHLVYGLGSAGAQLLALNGEAVDPKLSWTTKNSRASSLFLVHTLETTEAMLCFEAACARRALSLIDHAALLPFMPEATQTLEDPFRLRVGVQDGAGKNVLTAIPDRLLSIAGLKDNRRINLALELDRGSMQVAARRLTDKSSFARKIAVYTAAYRNKRFRSQWGFQGLRIATVTTSSKRIGTMLEVQRHITGNRLGAMFAYTTSDALKSEGPLAPIWTTSERDRVSLL